MHILFGANHLGLEVRKGIKQLLYKKVLFLWKKTMVPGHTSEPRPIQTPNLTAENNGMPLLIMGSQLYKFMPTPKAQLSLLTGTGPSWTLELKCPRVCTYAKNLVLWKLFQKKKNGPLEMPGSGQEMLDQWSDGHATPVMHARVG